MGISKAPKILTFETVARFEDAAVDYLCAQLKSATQNNGKTTLLLSGGSTPGPIYERLAQQRLRWASIAIALVDERWVGLKNPGSNSALLKDTILQDKAAKCRFIRMKSRHNRAADGQKTIEAKYRALPLNKCVAVLGMGMDGHVCSWFPGAEGLAQALDPANDNLVQAIMAKRSDVTGPYLERMTVTLSALNRCGSVLLLIKGDDKKALLDRAIKDRPRALPVTHLLNTVGDRLTIMCAG